jgi:hypothetical protein
VSVGTTATLIGTFEGTQTGVLISNPAGQTVYLGGSGVTTSTGFPVAASTVLTVPTNGGVGCQLYGVVTSSTATVSYLHPTNGGYANL